MHVYAHSGTIDGTIGTFGQFKNARTKTNFLQNTSSHLLDRYGVTLVLQHLRTEHSFGSNFSVQDVKFAGADTNLVDRSHVFGVRQSICSIIPDQEA